ncbi:MAG: TIGR02646 family protein [Leptospiraceae bacterium]|nr:TIGR02646 family protein [Leptospiraceae bacterium]MCP5500011.1 TIGR02646 family protein [Leptospiraceae bacterium]
MRYIHKRKRCRAFDSYVKRKRTNKWSQFNSSIKFELHQHLWKEQKGLCVYCEQAIPEKRRKDDTLRHHPSHIEHIKPKSKYKHLAFSYRNLALACNGFNCASEDEKGEFCEYAKKDMFNSNLFLNPVEVRDIEDYFTFDIDGNIKPNRNRSAIEIEKARYMIELLDLQNPNLKSMRAEQYTIFIEEELAGVNVRAILKPDRFVLPGFYTMLKQFFGEPFKTDTLPPDGQSFL